MRRQAREEAGGSWRTGVANEDDKVVRGEKKDWQGLEGGVDVARLVDACLVQPASWLAAAILALKVRPVLQEALPLERRVVAPRVREEGIALAGVCLGGLLEEARVLVVSQILLFKGRDLDRVQAAVRVANGFNRVSVDHCLYNCGGRRVAHFAADAAERALDEATNWRTHDDGEDDRDAAGGHHRRAGDAREGSLQVRQAVEEVLDAAYKHLETDAIPQQTERHATG